MRQKHDEVLIRRGPVGDNWRTFTVPFNKDLRKKKKFKKIKDKNFRYNMTLFRMHMHDEELWGLFNALCRGEKIR